MICGSGGSKSRLAKAAGAEPAGQIKDEQMLAVVVRNTFWSENMQSTSDLEHFWTIRPQNPQKVHAIVGRSTCGSEHIQNTSAPEHCWKLRCRISAHRCGAKHILKSKVVKTHNVLGTLLEVAMSKKCKTLWREAHFEVKMYKAPQCRTTFGS